MLTSLPTLLLYCCSIAQKAHVRCLRHAKPYPSVPLWIQHTLIPWHEEIRSFTKQGVGDMTEDHVNMQLHTLSIRVDCRGKSSVLRI